MLANLKCLDIELQFMTEWPLSHSKPNQLMILQLPNAAQMGRMLSMLLLDL
jgi:hypothetical protein